VCLQAETGVAEERSVPLVTETVKCEVCELTLGRVQWAVFLAEAQQPKSGLDRLLLGFSRSHSDTPQSVGLLWTSDQTVAEISTWQHTNTPKR
jgi:hypothetical protein